MNNGNNKGMNFICGMRSYMDSDNIILALVIADLRDRAEVGFKKYGCTIDRSPDDMLQHLYEELLDAAMYIKTRINQEKRMHGHTTHNSKSPTYQSEEAVKVREEYFNQQLPLHVGDYL